MTFELDTSGAVRVLIENTGGEQTYAHLRWDHLSPFEQGYVEAMFAGLRERSKRYDFISGAEKPYGFSDLAPETLAAIKKDCAALHSNMTPSPLPNTKHGGGVFWRERSEGWKHQHFRWSKRRLSDAFPPCTITLNDAGKVVFAE